MAAGNARVLVGGPVTSYKEGIIGQFTKGLKSLSYKNREVVLLDNSPDDKMFIRLQKVQGIKVEKTGHLKNAKEMVARDREALRERALQDGFDYLLFLDQDIIAPGNAVERLVSHGKGVCCGLYFNYFEFAQGGKKVWRLLPVYYTQMKGREEAGMSKYLGFDDVFPSRVLEIKKGGLGCALLHRSALEKVKFRAKTGVAYHADFTFFGDCAERGIKAWLDSSVLCRHMISVPAGASKEGWWK